MYARWQITGGSANGWGPSIGYEQNGPDPSPVDYSVGFVSNFIIKKNIIIY